MEYAHPLPEKAKRQWWRPLFRIGTLAILVTLMCGYFATWRMTKRQAEWLAGNPDRGNGRVVCSAGSPAPLVVYGDEYQASPPTQLVAMKRHYYLWLLGPMIPAQTVLLLAILSGLVIWRFGFAGLTHLIDGSQFVQLLIVSILILVGVLIWLLMPAVQ